MDDIAPHAKIRLSAAEMERRRKIVDMADSQNRIEGIFRGPETESIVEDFVRGDIEATDLVRLFKAQPTP